MYNKMGLVGLVCSILLTISILTYSVTYGGKLFAQETGGYPWASATEVNLSDYVWGYNYCPDEMKKAQTCSAHYAYKAGIRYHASDPWLYDIRNCTSFVAWRIFDSFNISLRGWGDAKNWDNAAKKNGYKVDNNPRKFDIAIWNSGRYGHVAFVTEVNPDGSVNIEQYNKAGKGEFSRQSRVRADEYIHVAADRIDTIKPLAIPEVPKIEDLISESISANATTLNDKIAQAVPITSKQENLVTDNNEIKINNDFRKEVKEKLSNLELEKANKDTSYFVGTAPLEQKVKLYEIKHKNTKSGKVEIKSQIIGSNEINKVEEKISQENIINNDAVSYSMADYNADGILDMYSINYGSSSSKNIEISVLNGKDNFSNYIGKWQTSSPKQSSDSTWYGTADYNGDGKLDVYQIKHNNTDNGYLNLQVLNGDDNFKSLLIDVIIPEKVHSKLDAYYMIGDINDDGKNDIFQVRHNNTVTGYNEVKVFDGSIEHREVISKWQTEQKNYQGIGPIY